MKSMAASSAALMMPNITFPRSEFSPKASNDNKMIWANHLLLGTNMWEDHPYITRRVKWTEIDEDEIYKDDFKCKTCAEEIAWGVRAYRPFLVFDEEVWNSVLQNMVNAGMNMLVIDVADGVQYESHPEISVKNAWSIEKLRAELEKVRKLGIEPIPKLNFAATHDAWLGEYSRMVSTRKYYEVCSNLISEVIDIFDNPRFFHLGMDEETASHQLTQNYAVMRQHDLWWNDLFFFINETEKKGVRSWIWSDYGWRNPDMFFEKMPKSVLQSNWYYGAQFDTNQLKEPSKRYVDFYRDLEEHGYDQMPTGSNFNVNTNIEGTVEYCKQHVAPERLLGFLVSPWLPTLPACLSTHNEAIQQISNAKKRFYQ